MGGLTGVLTFVQRWCVVALVVLLAVCLLKIATLEAEVSEVKLAWQTEKLDREAAARAHERELFNRERTHATEQQGAEDAFAKEKARLVGELAVATGDVGRLRQRLKDATRASARDSTDPVACQRAINSLDELGGLAAEGAELVVEARHLLAERDIDVGRLRDQVTIDRKACGQPAT